MEREVLQILVYGLVFLAGMLAGGQQAESAIEKAQEKARADADRLKDLERAVEKPKPTGQLTIPFPDQDLKP